EVDLGRLARLAVACRHRIPASSGGGAVGRLPGVALLAAFPLDACQIECRLDLGAVDDEGHAHRLPATCRIERDQPDVGIGVGLAAGLDLHHGALCVHEVEHRVAPHLPIGVAGV